jgi:hypothetical protein
LPLLVDDGDARGGVDHPGLGVVLVVSRSPAAREHARNHTLLRVGTMFGIV